MSYERSVERSAVLENVDCYENLANAIVLQAVKDYKKALFRLEDHPNNRDAKYEKKKLEQFFHSGWYNTLTDLDADTLIAGVRARVKIEAVERRKKKAENLRRKAERDMKKLVKMLTEAGAVLLPENIRALGDTA